MEERQVLVLQVVGARHTVGEARELLEGEGAVEVEDLVEEGKR